MKAHAEFVAIERSAAADAPYRSWPTLLVVSSLASWAVVIGLARFAISLF